MTVRVPPRILQDSRRNAQGIAIFFLFAIMILAISFPTNNPKAMADTPKVDFNGDGYADLAIGVPNEGINGKASAGSVNIIYGSTSGLSATSTSDQRFFQDYSVAGADASTNIKDVSEVDDHFGAAVAAGDFNGDGYSDLAIGVPDEDVGSSIAGAGAGAVNVIYGSKSGLSPNNPIANQFWTQTAAKLKVSQPGDHFGATLATGDFDNDGYADLAIGVAFDKINGKAEAGSVTILYGSTSGLSTSASVQSQRIFEDSPRIMGISEVGDHFGASLAVGDFNKDGYSDLAVGAPEKDDGLGGVNIIYGSASGLSATSTPNQLWGQDSPGLEKSAEQDSRFGAALASGDFNADGYSDLAIGVPGHISVVFGALPGLSAASVPDVLLDPCESCFYAFGSVLASGDFNGDGFADLATGDPNSSAGSSGSTPGEAWVFNGESTGISASPSLDLTGFPLQSGFGAALAAGDFDNDGLSDLAIGAPNWNTGQCSGGGGECGIFPGMVQVWYRPVPEYPHGSDQVWTQDSPGVEDVADDGDMFGAALASG